MRGEFMPKKFMNLFLPARLMWSTLAALILYFTANSRDLPLGAIEVFGEPIFEKSSLPFSSFEKSSLPLCSFEKFSPLFCSTDPPFL
jgi:hypothetical protein